jgi:prepilin-type N-terminal cleavage/methylation domain-containing protein
MDSSQKNRGFGLIEVIVSLSIAAVLAISFFTLLIYSKSLSRHNLDVLKAELYLTEVAEQVRDIEHTSWSTLNTNSCESPAVCHIEESSGFWDILSGEEQIDSSFKRKIYIEEVYRDQLSYTIVDSGGALDVSTKKVVIEVAWTNVKGLHVRDLEIYVFEN